MDRLIDWLMDIKTLLAFLFVTLLVFWRFGGQPDRLLNMAENVLTAIFSLAVGYKLGKAALNATDNGNPPAPLPPTGK